MKYGGCFSKELWSILYLSLKRLYNILHNLTFSNYPLLFLHTLFSCWVLYRICMTNCGWHFASCNCYNFCTNYTRHFGYTKEIFIFRGQSSLQAFLSCRKNQYLVTSKNVQTNLRVDACIMMYNEVITLRAICKHSYWYDNCDLADTDAVGELTFPNTALNSPWCEGHV